ncbi:hypothetical protein GGTG_09000 [Gaeumannomyces tritici R3-111a-1]|uniref:Rad50/SbcC-type AAA domain-containing protein n=1 Tax=Gaeumannomyces tritici (strain R3-111a-1) TaxID=644352 RepID=J3P659_GAET3|nr:hypothetical protein GGTG_09000 [Gaeumannomyces tritici R3-111a-1]EJT72132.1 hypothetical protein GGTG_09000 [Gaeumannomyces tritici R3-111a-1]
MPSGFAMPSHAAKIARWLLCSDIHFRHKDLDRVRVTADWIVAKAEQHQVQRAVICGDLLTSRTMQPTHVLSACYRFIGNLSDAVPHVNILLGNHDLAYRRDYHTTALDAHRMRRLSPFISLHSNIERHVWDGRRVLLLPFREEQDELTAAVDALDPTEAGETVAFAHLAIHKAILQRHIVRSTPETTPSYPARYRGLTGPGRFASLARTFTGHFHSHQIIRQPQQAASADPLQGSLMYLGSPLQMSWADLNDEQRGVVLLDPSTLACEMLVNPYAPVYATIDVKDALGGTASMEVVTGKHVMLLGEMSRFKYATARDNLLTLGARSVRDWSPMGPVNGGNRASGGLGASIPESDAAIQELEQPAEDLVARDTESGVPAPSPTEIAEPTQQLDLGAEVGEYIDSISLDPSLEPRRKQLTQTGQRLIHASSAVTDEDVELELDLRDFLGPGDKSKPVRLPESEALARPSANVFVAEPQSLVIKNFLGVQGVLTVDFKRDLPRGLIFLVGANGSGKSTIVEAMVWCQFGKCIRSSLGANDVVNDTAGKDCSVSLSFSNGYTITRYRKDKSFKNDVVVSLYGEPMWQMQHPDARTTQAAIDELLGIDCDTYVRSVVLGHESATSFLNATPTQRRDIIEQSLGLSTLERCAQMSRLILKELDRQMGDIQIKLVGVANVKDSNKRELGNLEQSQKALTLEVESVAQALSAAAQRHAVIFAKVMQQKADTAAFTKLMESSRSGLKHLELSREELASEAGKVTKALNAAIQRHALALKRAEEDGGAEIRALAPYIAEVDGRIAAASQNSQHLFKESNLAELCIAFHAEMSTSLSRLSSAKEGLEQLQDLYRHLSSQKAARPKPWWEREEQRCLHKLDVLLSTRPVGLPKIMSSATSLFLHLQLHALRAWAAFATFLQKDDGRQELEAAVTAVGSNVKHAANNVLELQFNADTAPVADRVATSRRIDREEVERAATMPLETARTANERLDRAIQTKEKLRREREVLLARVREQEQRLQREREALIAQAREEEQRLQRQHEALLARVMEQGEKLRRQREALLDQEKEHEQKIQRQQQALDAQVREMEQLQAKVEGKKREAAIYQGLAEEKKATISSLQTQDKELGAELAQLVSTHELFAFWTSAFAKRTRRISTAAGSSKAITTFREHVLNQSLAELNALLPQILAVLYNETRHMNALATGILGVLFEKDGSGEPLDAANTATPMLDNTLAVNPALAYGKRSSGERKRMDLAVFFALLQVRHARSFHRAHYLLVDEVFDSLDEAGQAAVVRWCAYAARRVAGRIIVITHSRVLIDQADHYLKEGELGSVVTIRADMKESGTALTFGTE